MTRLSESYYRATAHALEARTTLCGRHDTAVCVVGAGFAGPNTALGLAERGHSNVVLLESQRIGHGASGRNGGFVFGGYSRSEVAPLHEPGPAWAKDLRERRKP